MVKGFRGLLRKAALIISDDASMMDRRVFKMVGVLLKDL